MVSVDGLHFRKVGLAFYDLRYGRGTGEILLDDVVCVGNETSLINCQHADFGDINCFHQEDISIMCLDNFFITGTANK